MLSEELLSFPRIHPSRYRKPQEKLRQGVGKQLDPKLGIQSVLPFPFIIYSSFQSAISQDACEPLVGTLNHSSQL
jgi:hypothetical protein